ncbi:hypothetical protein Pmar_PMAR006786 [Perkinsus marinus ATCC 50983]|uniref:Uncharacterized protein n=1 Tax=Perkinsus marinus (strain ATCC 50983 / TXsc) TaxID=423536 RepID=C5K6H4_PERM5|nr:hypothetical protein Pmar_PMAR006786 [Perkinsus marinus ATCC 50983]EER19894.1 hypothetical protein Pmar_PMAR006786 [Perkinsus marinus ATCC 50983]|eukprot:XP_002788098.1 hypothetical protein Pmar_PMAR006786 [Perkinsus marinus ATCC 50983]
MLRLKSLFVTETTTQRLLGVITKECFDATPADLIQWSEGSVHGGGYRRFTPGSFSQFWAEDWHSATCDGGGKPAAPSGTDHPQCLAAPGDIEMPQIADSLSDIKPPPDLNYSNEETTNHGDHTRGPSSPSTPPDYDDDDEEVVPIDPSPSTTASGIGLSPTTTQVRSGRQLLRLARSLSRESDSSPLRWLEVSDATLDLVTHRTGIRLVEALEVGRLMVQSNVADSSLKSALSKWVAESRDEDAVGTGTLLEEGRLAIEALGTDDPACTEACRRILWRAKNMNPDDLLGLF